MMTSPINCMARMAVNVRPRAPRAGGAAIFDLMGFCVVISDSRGRVELTVRSGSW